MAYCTEDNFQISPGLFTHDLTIAQVEANSSYGCCQKFTCNIPCPVPFNDAGVSTNWGVAVVCCAAFFVTMGVLTGLYNIKGNYKNFFICDRSLPLWVVSFTLMAQGLDSNASLGNVANAYKYGFWDGAVLPIGLGISLILNCLTLSGPINRMRLLTLPDLFARKYGKMMEVIVSCIELTSFTFLLAGNLVGVSIIMQFLFSLPKIGGVVIAGSMMAIYTIVGGLFSLAYTDILQACTGFTGMLVVAIYVLTTTDPPVAGPSKGFVFDLGNNVTAATPGYIGRLNCVDPVTGELTCDNFAYPVGDSIVYKDSMTSADAYAPFPNAILANWASIIVLGLGNLCALDFQARSMASKTPMTARMGNLIAGLTLLAVSVPFGLIAAVARKYYGPDSPSALFSADTCSAPLGLPSCAEWVPDEKFVLFKMLWTKFPRALGGWVCVAIVNASMSTADGAILATSTVLAHNIWRKIPRIGSNEKNLLMVVRCFVVPMTVLGCIVAASTYNPGYLLVVAFDIVFAGVFVPLMAAVYWPAVTPNAGLIACICGSALRLILEFTLPKDRSLVAFGTYALDYGKAKPGLPSFMEVTPVSATADAGIWDPAANTCEQRKLEDWTGLDSLVSPVFCLLVLLAVMGIERAFPGRDLLWYIPRAWRSPVSSMYPVEEDKSVFGPGAGTYSGEPVLPAKERAAMASLEAEKSVRNGEFGEQAMKDVEVRATVHGDSAHPPGAGGAAV